MVGEAAAGAAGLASLGRAITLASFGGNAAFDIYTAVQDKDNAALAVIGLLLGVGGAAAAAREGDSFATLGAARRSGSGKIAEMGRLVDDQALSIQKILKSCTK